MYIEQYHYKQWTISLAYYIKQIVVLNENRALTNQVYKGQIPADL